MFGMDLGQIPLFAMLRGRMGYLSERQKVIAENVANSDTPGYAPRDLKPFSFQFQAAQQSSAGVQAATLPGHMVSPHARGNGPGGSGGPRAKAVRSNDSETTLDGNSVVLEEEMMKMTDARMNYDAAIGFYQKSLNLLRLAAKPPGRV